MFGALSYTSWTAYTVFMMSLRSTTTTISRQELYVAFYYGSPISMSHTMSFVYHLPQGYNQSHCGHPGCQNILKNSLTSLCGIWKEGCGSDEGKERVFSADRCPVEHADRVLNSDHLYGFGHCLHTTSTISIAIGQDISNHVNKLTPIWPWYSFFFFFL